MNRAGRGGRDFCLVEFKATKVEDIVPGSRLLGTDIPGDRLQNLL